MELRANDYCTAIVKCGKCKGLRQIDGFSRRGDRVRALCALCRRVDSEGKWVRAGGGFLRGSEADPGLTPPGYIMSPLCGLSPGWVGLRSACVPGAHAAGLYHVAALRLIAGLGCTNPPGAHARGLYDTAAPRLPELATPGVFASVPAQRNTTRKTDPTARNEQWID